MNKLTWLHVSDIHFNSKTKWRDTASFDGLVRYLESEFATGNLPKPDIIFCTGDIAFGETSKGPLTKQYKEAISFFDELLRICGTKDNPLSKDMIFVVPGNHDVNRNSINGDAQAALAGWAKAPYEHISKINQRFNDKTLELTSAMSRLDEYGSFVTEYLPHQSDPENRHHYARCISVNGISIGVSGFNSAWTCSGPEDDRNIWMAASWQFSRSDEEIRHCDLKIGLIHHPIDWLNQADRDVANKRICQQYDFWLHGHAHNAWVTPAQNHVVIAAGAVGAEQSEEFGVNITQIDFATSKGCTYLLTRQENSDWTASPIPNFAPLGKWSFDLPSNLKKTHKAEHHISGHSHQAPNLNIITERHFEQRLKESLKLFSGHASEWIDPTIAVEPENKSRSNSDAIEKIPLETIISSPRDMLICAPAQYGQTCLAHHLINESWRRKNKYWLYMDAKSLRPNKDSISKQTERELDLSARTSDEISCVILDSWSPDEKESQKLISKVYEYFDGIPVICMQHIPETIARSSVSTKPRTPEILHLWSLSRENVRKIVSSYNDKKPIGSDESIIVNRLISDMETLNLHRTPLNCLTLLKVSEIDFDENPVNRTEIIRRVLFLLFNLDDLPSYKTKPDLKDCEHVLGYLCEQLIREGSYGFTRDRFLRDLHQHAQSQLMDLETQLVFDILYKNNIIGQRGELFYFKFSYWLFYFAAQRMHHSDEFSKFIMSEMRYTQHPELVEFYTGIDRKREDALITLTRDLSSLRAEVHKSCGLPESLNPYRLGKWTPTPDATERMQQEVANGVAESNLPSEIKDKYADRDYDQTRPYNQVAGSILQEHHFVNLVMAIRAGSRALRNSDYANIGLKKELLSEILKGWEQVTRIILTVLPTLTEQSSATYDGVSIILLADMPESETLQERFIRILSYIPYSVSREFSDDLFSMKMGPLLSDRLNSAETSELNKHELILMILNKRPRDWQKTVSRYITQVQHNSFYLYDIYVNLRSQYRYAFAPKKTLDEIEYLIKMAAAKHVSGSKSPTAKLIEKISGPDIVPTRDIKA